MQPNDVLPAEPRVVTSYDNSTGKHGITTGGGDRKAVSLKGSKFTILESIPLGEVGSSTSRALTVQASKGEGSKHDDDDESWDKVPSRGSGGGTTGGYSSTSSGSTNYGTSNYGYSYTQAGSAYSYIPVLKYKPKDARSRTVATFRVLVDPRALRAGDRVTVTGNVAELTEWGDGVDMVPMDGVGGDLQVQQYPSLIDNVAAE